MPKSFLNYKGLFGDQSEPFEQLSVHYEPLRTRSAFYNFEIQEHLHTDLAQVFFITSGGGLLLSSGKKIRLEGPCSVLIPSHVLHGFAFQSEVKGDVFTVSEPLFEQVLKNAPKLFSGFDRLQYFSFDSGAPLFIEMLDLKSKIIKELEQADKATEVVLPMLFQLFFIGLYRSKKEGQKEDLNTDDRTLSHFYNLKKLIKKHLPEGRNIQFYAREMNLTTVHLNRICKAVKGQSALQIVHEQILLEAKKYLHSTTYSLSEIAYFLGFKDPAHFSKFFKKKTGVAPGSFRRAAL